MAANGISELATKELRQKAKLDLAATKRAADGNPRATYDLDLLPTIYVGNEVVDNPNGGGLVQGRPWRASLPSNITTEAGDTLITEDGLIITTE